MMRSACAIFALLLHAVIASTGQAGEPARSSLEEACSAFGVTGTASADRRTAVAWNRDGSYLQNPPHVLRLVEPRGGYRYIALVSTADRFVRRSALDLEMDPDFYPIYPAAGGAYILSGINEMGVSSQGNVRDTWQLAPDGYVPARFQGAPLHHADSARKAVEVAESLLAKRGSAVTGLGMLFGDATEIRLWEASGHESASAVFVSDIAAHTNFYLLPSMTRYERSIYRPSEAAAHISLARYKRARSLLEGHPGPVPLDYLMRVSRDKGVDRHCEASGSSCDDDLDNWGRDSGTIAAQIAVSHPVHPGLLSVIWVSLSNPGTTPFLPFFIGITEIPASFTSDAAWSVFWKLHLLVKGAPDQRKYVERQWTDFELEMLREVRTLETEVAKLFESGQEVEARRRLTDFVERKSHAALAQAAELIKQLGADPS